MKLPRFFTRGDAWPRPDFLPARRRVAWVWWAALGASCMACAVATVEWMELRDAVSRERESTQRWRAEAARRNGPKASPAVVDIRSRESAERVAAGLSHPWAPLLSAIERATPDDVRWLALSHAAGDASVRLEGEAGDAAQALAVVDRLAMEPGWSTVMLTRLAVGEGANAAKLRFEITARVLVNAAARGAS